MESKPNAVFEWTGELEKSPTVEWKNMQESIKGINLTEVEDQLLSNIVTSIRPETAQGRDIGNSTRLIDYYVQELFANGVIRVKDHVDNYATNKLLMSRILRRLEFEHPNVMDGVSVYYGHNEIKLER